MKSWLAFALLIFSAQLQASTDPCANALTVKADVRFEQVVNELHKLDLKNLTAGLDSGRLKVVFHHRYFAFQARVAPSRWSFRDMLVIRELKWENEEQKSQRIFEVAMALYTLEVRNKFWSKSSMWPSNRRGERAEFWGRDLLINLPKAWRDERLAQVANLEAEIYQLAAGLPALQVGKILPKLDPGRHWWSNRLGPNRKDYELYLEHGTHTLSAVQNERHGVSLLLRYYLDWGARAAVIATPLLIGIPLVLPDDPHTTSATTFARQLEQVPDPDMTPAQLREYRAAARQRERRRLEEQVTKEKNKLYPDTARIADAERLLREFNDQDQ